REVRVAVRRVVQAVDPLEVLDRLQLRPAVRARARLALVARYRFERVQHDLLEQLAERLVVELGQPLQHLDQPCLHADPELYPLDPRCRITHDAPPLPWSLGTKVTACRPDGHPIYPCV